MNKWIKITAIVIFVFIVGLLGYDAFVIVVGGKEASVSATIIRWSYKYPSFTFLIGFTFGHLFWKMSDKDVHGDKQ